MKKNDDQYEKIFIQSIKDDFNQESDPLYSKEQTWNEISKQLFEKRNRTTTFKSGRLVAALFALFIIGSTFFYASSTSAFGWIKEFFVSQEGSTAYIHSGSKPADDSNMKPPSAEEIVVHEGVSKSHSVNISEAHELASFHLYVPTYIPDGYSENEAIVDCYNDKCNVITLLYKGVEDNPLTIKQHFFAGAYGTGGSVSNVIETKQVTVNGTEATLIITSHENLKFLKWSKHNIEFTVDGYLSEDEILQVAESLE
jgi:hypothetical protein